MKIGGKHKKLNNAGFTLVEMIVVLVIMVILLSLSVVGIMAWQDWSKMKQLNANAETIFMAVQNQLSAYSSSGSLKREVEEAILNADGESYAVTELTKNGADGSVAVSSITDSDGNPYSWDELWSTSQGKADKEKYQGRIVSLSSKPGDYEKYLKGEELSRGTKLLFKLVTSYVYDKSILNDAAIMIELSPDAGQVFAVCYSSSADQLSYTEGEGVCVSDRTETLCNEIALGYYGVDSLSKAIKGKTDNTLNIEAGAFELRNEEILNAIYSPKDPDDIFGTGKDLKFTLNLYDPDITTDDRSQKKIMSLEFDLNADNPLPTGMKNAQGSGAREMKATYYKDGAVVPSSGDIVFRVPVWVELSANGSRVIRIALDAADVQAQSLIYAMATGLDESIMPITDEQKENAAEAFSKTYSFYRFGLDADRIYLGLKIRDNTDNSETDEQFSSSKGGVEPNLNGEYACFDKVIRDDEKAEYEISNARHLYNVRYVEDYADRIDTTATYKPGELINNKDWHVKCVRDFVLIKNIGWRSFVAYQYRGSNAGYDYYFNSYDITVKPNKDNKIVYSGIGLAGLETETEEFPSFRQLCYGDSFSSRTEEAGNLSISDLTITTEANERYGVYGHEAMDSDHEYLKNGTAAEFDKLELSRARGEHPTGLFNVNYGEIKELTLAGHKVFGAYKVGGFAGENLGTLSKLTLRNEENTAGVDKTEAALISRIEQLKLVVPYFEGSNKINNVYYYKIRYGYQADDAAIIKGFLLNELYGRNTSFVVGIHDVGGIFGYQKYIAGEAGTTAEAVYDELVNEAWVSGQDYVGGITGRSIVNYSDDALTDRYVSLMPANSAGSITRKSLKKVSYEKCENSGRLQALPVYDIDGYTSNPGIEGNDPNARSAHYIGGICGMACDNRPANTFDELQVGIKFDNCHSFWLYTQDEIDKMISGRAGDLNSLFAQMRGSYVGGITGFARLASFSDCKSTSDSQDEGKAAYIFGRYYVGGIAGVAQLCDFSTTEDDGQTTNSVNVIAVSTAGGIAGVIGTPKNFLIGDKATEHFKAYQYDPWKLKYEQPEGGRNSLQNANDRLLNTGLVYAFGSNDAKNYALYGGICGFNGEEINNCDSIQSVYARQQMLKLITMIDGNVEYCGKFAGGIAGYNSWRINHSSDSFSRINTIVYGESHVGGAAGYINVMNTDDGNESRRNALRNCYLVDSEEAVALDAEGISAFKGSYIRAQKDYAGGICGLLEWGSALNDSRRAVDADIVVHADNYAGGFVGCARMGSSPSIPCQYSGCIKAKENDGLQKIIADGFYAGGFVGAVSLQGNHSSNNDAIYVDAISGVSEVKASYFAGGFAGASVAPNGGSHNGDFYVDDHFYQVVNEKMKIEADVCAGGYCGYYEVWGSEDHNVLERLYNTFAGHTSDAADFVAQMEKIDHNGMYSADYLQANLGSHHSYNVNTLMIDDNVINVGSVTAQYCAGGLFGYVPDEQSIFISYKGECNVTTTGDALEGGYTWAGGITGRVGSRMVLDDCLNKGVLTSSSDYYGNLCELNKGVIQNCSVGYAFTTDGSSGHSVNHRYVGGLCGRNEGRLEGFFNSRKNQNEYERSDVTGLEYVGGLCGENVAAIRFKSFMAPVSVESEAFAGGICGLNRGTINYIEDGISSAYNDKATIKGKYAGLIAGHNEGTIEGITLDSPAQLNAVNTAGEAGAAASFAGVNAGTVKDCVNLSKVSVGNGAAAGFAGLAEANAQFINLVNKADIKAGGVAAGIVALVNDDGNVTIENCRNYGTITSDNSYGITGGNAVISNCLEAGGIASADYVYGGNKGGSNNYFIAGTLDKTGHDVTVNLSTGDIEESFTAERAGKYVFKLFTKKTNEDGTVSGNTIVEAKELELEKDRSISLSVNAVYDLLGINETEYPIDTEAEYQLTITIPAGNYNGSRELTQLFRFKEGDHYDLYAVIDAIPVKSKITGLVYDPLDFDVTPRADEIDAKFEVVLQGN